MQYTKSKCLYILLIYLAVTLFSCVNTQAAISNDSKTRAKPDTVTGISATSNASHVNLTWNRVDNCDSYIIYRKTPDTEWKRIVTININSIVSYIDTNPVKGQNNIYTVQSYNSKTQSLGDYNKKGYEIDISDDENLPVDAQIFLISICNFILWFFLACVLIFVIAYVSI